MNMKKTKRFFNGSVVATFLLVVVLVSNMAIITGMFRNYIERETVRILWENITSLKSDITKIHRSEWNQMNILRNVIETQSEIDAAKMKNILSSFMGGGMTEELFFLLPDNRILSKDGVYVENTLGLNYQIEWNKGNYIFAGEGGTAYRALPLEGKGKINGILYGVMSLDNMVGRYQGNYFGGRAELYLMERKSGKFLMDTWNEVPMTLSELGERKWKKGYSVEKIERDISQGLPGIAIFEANETGENTYLCYEPIGISDWIVALTVPESAAFSHDKAIQTSIGILAGVEVVAVVLYFIWILWYKQKENIAKEAQLNQVSYMFEIQKALFDVHRKPEHMEKALEIIGKKLRAEMAFFITTEKEKIGGCYTWYQDGIARRNYPLSFCDIERDMGRGESYAIYDLEKLKKNMPSAYEKMQELGIHNVMVTQISGDEDVVGILGAWNMSYRWEDARYLECVAMLFSTAYNNIKNQKIIGEMASVDSLTGLLNRNSFERSISEYDKSEEKTCAGLYIDVNGLHELNNKEGHAAGDEMLKFVANAVQELLERKIPTVSVVMNFSPLYQQR